MKKKQEQRSFSEKVTHESATAEEEGGTNTEIMSNHACRSKVDRREGTSVGLTNRRGDDANRKG